MEAGDPLPVPTLPPRPADSHKGTYGQVLIVCGSRGMAGAAALAGKGALRGGAGLVRLAVPKSIADVVAAYEPAYLTVPLVDDAWGRAAAAAQRRLSELDGQAIAVGPGWGQSPGLGHLLGTLWRRPRPLVVDADALNLLAEHRELLAMARTAPTLLTPHPGEFARLCGCTTRQVQADRQRLAEEYAREHRLLVVLKGHHTIVTDGAQTAINQTGNPGMATGGSGDVLTGLLAALLAQGLQPFAAARLAVDLHGRAGDDVAERIGQDALIASDLPDGLTRVMRTAETDNPPLRGVVDSPSPPEPSSP